MTKHALKLTASTAGVHRTLTKRSAITKRDRILWLCQTYNKGRGIKPQYLKMLYKRHFGSIKITAVYSAAYTLRVDKDLKPFDPSYKP